MQMAADSVRMQIVGRYRFEAAATGGKESQCAGEYEDDVQHGTERLIQQHRRNESN